MGNIRNLERQYERNGVSEADYKKRMAREVEKLERIGRKAEERFQ